MAKTEVERLLGSATYRLAQMQADNAANNPANQAEVEENLAEMIDAGFIDPEGETATVMRAALQGQWFQQMEQGGVCMDDVTPEDR